MGYNKDIDANDNTKGNPRHMYVDCGHGLITFFNKSHPHTHTHTPCHTHTHTLNLRTHIHIYIATFMKFAWQNVGQFVKLGSETHTERDNRETIPPYFVKLISYISQSMDLI